MQQEQTAATAPVALRRRDAARALGLSITTVDRAIKRGDLHAKKYGARVLVPRSEIDRYLKAMREAFDGLPAENS